MPPLELVSATANAHKVYEIRAILGEAVTLVARPSSVPDVIEDALTLSGNARLKAAAICRAVGLAAVADDTGLEVDALDGAPGVHTARFGGPSATAADNIAKLLHELAGVPAGERTARFRTAALVMWPDGRVIRAEGLVEGVIRSAPSGSGGFGYDPVFEPVESGGLTFAEMDDAAKNAISHRGRAFRELLVRLES